MLEVMYGTTPRLVSLYEDTNYDSSLISKLSYVFYSYVCYEDSKVSLNSNDASNLRKRSLKYGHEVYERVLSEIPKNIKELAFKYQKISKESELMAYVYTSEFLPTLCLFFIAIPVRDGFLYPLVIDIRNSKEYKVSSLRGTTYHGYSNGLIPENLIEQSLMELGSKSRDAFVNKVITTRKKAIL